MALTSRQREAAEIYRQEEEAKEWLNESRYRARYLSKFLQDIGDLQDEKAEKLLDEIRVRADHLKLVLGQYE